MLRRDSADGLIRDAAAAVLRAALALAVVVGAVGWAARFGWAFAATALALYGAAAVVLLAGISAHHPFARFGAANFATLLRLALACLLAGAVAEIARAGAAPPAPVAWLLAGVAGTALALDGLDGALARRAGSASRFGARFDIEADGLLLLSLAGLALVLGKAGAWVLLIGALHYLFAAAGRVWPALAAPLPHSSRRKAVCVVQGAVLALLPAPAVVPPASTALAAAALALLVWSFAVDLRWLARRDRP